MNTKAIILTVTFGMVALLHHADAQIGIKAGVNIASMSESSTEATYQDFKNKSVVGFQAGLVFDLGLSDIFTIQPEVLYIQKGGKSIARLNDENKVESRLYYNYVEVPVLAKLKFFAGDSKSGFYLIGGPFAGLALGGKSKVTTTLLGASTTSETDFEFDNSDAADRQRRLDWGVAFGGGVKLGNVFLDARYNLGINNLLDRDANNQNDNKPYRRTRGIGLTIGFQF